MRNQGLLVGLVVSLCGCSTVIGVDDLTLAPEVVDANTELGPDAAISTCGDRVLDTGEQCDDGAETANCDGDCTLAACGDGVFNRAAEPCDSGGIDTGACNGNCTVAKCGDGIFNSVFEPCESGGQDTSACNADCTVPGCGDGLFNPAVEQCESNGSNSPVCDANCTLPVCGDGLFNSAAGEKCDGGGDTAACNSNCTLAACGDGIFNSAAEACESGGVNSPTCNANCSIPACGDGIVNPTTGEVCDTAGANTATCDTDCTARVCGDNFVNAVAGEACDSGGANTSSCDSDCTAPVCGDGIVNEAAGEQCDDGNATDDHNGCSATCTNNAVCGNGVLETQFEVCDTAIASSTITFCTSSCKAASAVLPVSADGHGENTNGGSFSVLSTTFSFVNVLFTNCSTCNEDRAVFEFSTTSLKKNYMITAANILFTPILVAGSFSVQVHGFVGNGTIDNADLTQNNLLVSVSALTTTKSASVTSFVQTVADQEKSFAGFMLRSATVPSAGTTFQFQMASKENSDASKRPTMGISMCLDRDRNNSCDP